MAKPTFASLGFEAPSDAAGIDYSAAADYQPEEITQTVSADPAEIAQACQESLDFLAAFVMPMIYKYAYPPVFLAVWGWLTSYSFKIRDFSQLALGLPRGFGKTNFIKIYVIYLILFTRKQFILVICENTSKAVNIITDVMSMLGEDNVRAVFGDWNIAVSTDRQDLKRFSYRGKDIILMAAGSETGVRGIVVDNRRPDCMIFDDVQSRECADSEQQSNVLEQHIVGTVMKAKSPEGCLYIFIANMYPTKHSILRKLKANPNWIKFIVGGILADGSSLWEELQPIKQLLREYQNDLAMGHPEIFFSEVLNDENASVNKYIDLSKLPAYNYGEAEVSAGSFVIIDPATDKANADAVSIGAFTIIDGKPVAREILEGRFSPGDTIRNALRLCFKHGSSLIAIESNSYQYTLKYWFEEVMKLQGLTGIQAVDIYSGSTSKNSRILTMFKSLMAGEIILHPDVKAQVATQVTGFNPLKRDNVDGVLDLLTYAPRVIEEFGQFIAYNSPSEQGVNADALVLEDESATSPF